MPTTVYLVDTLREQVRKGRFVSSRSAARCIARPATGYPGRSAYIRDGGKRLLTIVMIVGVNGSGKTTTIGKLAQRYKGLGYKVMLAAGDTFRAAAIDQLEIWGERADVPVIAGQPNGDPAAVAMTASAPRALRL